MNMIEDVFQIIGIITVLYWISIPLTKWANELIIKLLCLDLKSYKDSNNG